MIKFFRYVEKHFDAQSGTEKKGVIECHNEADMIMEKSLEALGSF